MPSVSPPRRRPCRARCSHLRDYRRVGNGVLCARDRAIASRCSAVAVGADRDHTDKAAPSRSVGCRTLRRHAAARRAAYRFSLACASVLLAMARAPPPSRLSHRAVGDVRTGAVSHRRCWRRQRWQLRRWCWRRRCWAWRQQRDTVLALGSSCTSYSGGKSTVRRWAGGGVRGDKVRPTRSTPERAIVMCLVGMVPCTVDTPHKRTVFNRRLIGLRGLGCPLTSARSAAPVTAPPTGDTSHAHMLATARLASRDSRAAATTSQAICRILALRCQPK
jgi:hypothetical protein